MSDRSLKKIPPSLRSLDQSVFEQQVSRLCEMSEEDFETLLRSHALDERKFRNGLLATVAPSLLARVTAPTNDLALIELKSFVGTIFVQGATDERAAVSRFAELCAEEAHKIELAFPKILRTGSPTYRAFWDWHVLMGSSPGRISYACLRTPEELSVEEALLRVLDQRPKHSFEPDLARQQFLAKLPPRRPPDAPTINDLQRYAEFLLTMGL